MTVSTALSTADELRPNAISDETKASLLYELEGHVAEMMGVEPPAFDFPAKRELLLQPPYDMTYVKYLVAMIDYYQDETTLYANDLTVFNDAMREAAAAWRRQHPTPDRKNWKVMP